MLESKQNLANEDHAKAFLGVRFVLFGFDSNTELKVRSKLLEGGGIDAVNYGPDCNHVIVDKLEYDDPICIVARRDGKTLVTGLWVDHSFDLGMPVDPTSVMYAPVRDFNGIHGAKSLVMCLTGYQRQDREDIMTMVALMGANFSKPLVATKVTHLICYKFEGEKYELAKKIKKIKLVNHRWLEDCLKAWQILPEADYSKSGYELEMEMEVEAKDSEEETEDVASKTDMERINIFHPQNTGTETNYSHLPSVKLDVSRKSLSPSAPKNLANVGLSSKIQSTPGKEVEFDKHLEMAGSNNARSAGNMPSEAPLNIGYGTVISEKAERVLASVSESAKRSPNCDVPKSSSKSYYRSPPRKSSLPLRIESNSGSPSTSNANKRTVSGGPGMSLERIHDGREAGLKTPQNGTLSHLEDGKITSAESKTPISQSNSKSPVLNRDLKRSIESKVVAETTELLASGSSTDRFHGDISTPTVACHFREEGLYAAKEDLKFSVTSEDRINLNNHMLQHSLEGLEKKTSSNLDIVDHSSSRPSNFIREVEMRQSDLRRTETPLPRTNPEAEKMGGQADVNYSKVGHSSSRLKSRKLLAKKTLGSRLTMFKTAKQKGSIDLQKEILHNEFTANSNGAIRMEDVDKDLIAEKVEKVPPAPKDNCSAGAETEAPDDCSQNEDDVVPPAPKDNCSAGAETGAPDDCSQNEDDVRHNKEKSADVEASHLRKGAIHAKSRADGKISQMKEQVPKCVGDKSISEAEKSLCGESTESIELNPNGNAEEKSFKKGKKRPLTKSMKNKLKDSGEGVKKNEPNNSKQFERKAVPGNDEAVSLAGKTKTRTRKKVKTPDDVEKENKPVEVKQKATSNDAGASGEAASQPLKKSPKGESKAENLNADALRGYLEVKPEPACFILSGHKLQRKEFQKVIKRLKGRVCRDSHNWSYQATHFIVPDPVRRTEKFFAAAASGSWILKTDYLTASNEAGRFLSEEPYEWHKKCLSEDGAINLEAPRKWRLLKKRTGHGAFCGMQIVIYGECIAPPLDTLKRVVKAGGGTILATSPPYTRYLKSGIDFAIVSPGMPPVDIWVQEFLRHKVPCVVTDYLVDYVCKPGYSLEKHIQYNTHAWAEESLKKLTSRIEQEEDTEDVKTPENNCIDDVACQLCGCYDRGEEMLICGDENGIEGCGVGMHIDCLDPPLDDVPEEDWFCLSCVQKKDQMQDS